MRTDKFHVDTKRLLEVVRALFSMFSSSSMVPTWYFASLLSYVVFINPPAYKTAWKVTTPKTLKHVCIMLPTVERFLKLFHSVLPILVITDYLSCKLLLVWSRGVPPHRMHNCSTYGGLNPTPFFFSSHCRTVSYPQGLTGQKLFHTL